MIKENLMYLIENMINDIKNGEDKKSTIDFTINCMEAMVDKEFAKEEWEYIYDKLDTILKSRGIK